MNGRFPCHGFPRDEQRAVGFIQNAERGSCRGPETRIPGSAADGRQHSAVAERGKLFLWHAERNRTSSEHGTVSYQGDSAGFAGSA